MSGGPLLSPGLDGEISFRIPLWFHHLHLTDIVLRAQFPQNRIHSLAFAIVTQHVCEVVKTEYNNLGNASLLDDIPGAIEYHVIQNLP